MGTLGVLKSGLKKVFTGNTLIAFGGGVQGHRLISWLSEATDSSPIS